MSKLMMIVVLLASAAIADPPRAIGLLGPQAQVIGGKIKAALEGSSRLLPQFSLSGRR